MKTMKVRRWATVSVAVISGVKIVLPNGVRLKYGECFFTLSVEML